MRALVILVVTLALSALSYFFYRAYQRGQIKFLKSTVTQNFVPTKAPVAKPTPTELPPKLHLKETSDCQNPQSPKADSWALTKAAIDELNEKGQIKVIGDSSCAKLGPLPLRLFYCFESWNSCVYLANSSATAAVDDISEMAFSQVNFSEVSEKPIAATAEPIKDFRALLSSWGYQPSKKVYVLTLKKSSQVSDPIAMAHQKVIGIKFAEIIDLKKATELVKAKALLIDVRQPAIFAKKKIKNSVNVPYYTDANSAADWRFYSEYSAHDKFDLGNLAKDKQTPVIVYGGPAETQSAALRALYSLRKSGFTKLFLLQIDAGNSH